MVRRQRTRPADDERVGVQRDRPGGARAGVGGGVAAEGVDGDSHLRPRSGLEDQTAYGGLRAPRDGDHAARARRRGMSVRGEQHDRDAHGEEQRRALEQVDPQPPPRLLFGPFSGRSALGPCAAMDGQPPTFRAIGAPVRSAARRGAPRMRRPPCPRTPASGRDARVPDAQPPLCADHGAGTGQAGAQARERDRGPGGAAARGLRRRGVRVRGRRRLGRRPDRVARGRRGGGRARRAARRWRRPGARPPPPG